jgi:hypothetical protein
MVDAEGGTPLSFEEGYPVQGVNERVALYVHAPILANYNAVPKTTTNVVPEVHLCTAPHDMETDTAGGLRPAREVLAGRQVGPGQAVGLHKTTLTYILLDGIVFKEPTSPVCINATIWRDDIERVVADGDLRNGVWSIYTPTI